MEAKNLEGANSNSVVVQESGYTPRDKTHGKNCFFGALLGCILTGKLDTFKDAPTELIDRMHLVRIDHTQLQDSIK